MYVYCIFSTYAIYDEVNPLSPRKYTVLNGNFMYYLHSSDLCDIFQEWIPDVTHELPVHVKSHSWVT
jgi:hypothetical protein